jgi:hypothetical protein
MATKTSGAVAAERLVNTLFGEKPPEIYGIFREEGGFKVVEFKETDGQRVETGQVWYGADIFIARGHVPVRNRVQIHPNPAHDPANLVEMWT